MRSAARLPRYSLRVTAAFTTSFVTRYLAHSQARVSAFWIAGAGRLEGRGQASPKPRRVRRDCTRNSAYELGFGGAIAPTSFNSGSVLSAFFQISLNSA